MTAFLFWRCRYGFGSDDESFYITIPFRLCQGDHLLLNEWHLSQTSSVLLVPAVKLHLLLFGNLDGVILHFRYLFTAVWSISSAFLFFRLKQFSARGAAGASYVFLLYAPFCITALSYNSMGILTLTLSTTILITAKTHRPLQYFISGLFYAASVLCCPFLATEYILYAAALVAIALGKKTGRMKRNCPIKRLFEIWLFETLGAAASALCFLAFVFHKVSIRQLLEVIPSILNDPEHSELSFKIKYLLLKQDIKEEMIVFLMITVCLFLVSTLSKKLNKICLIAMYVFTALYILHSFHYYRYINHVMFPLNLFGIYCALKYRTKTTCKLFFGMYVPGLIYTFCIYASSNQRFYAISSVLTASIAASILLIDLYTRKTFGKQGFRFMKLRICTSTLLLSSLLFFQLITEGYLRYENVFMEDSIKTQTEIIRFGPQKGVLATPEKRRLYTGMYEDISSFRSDESLQVVFLSENTWLYLCGSFKSSSYSAWLSGVDTHSIHRLKRYYEICKDKEPDLIFVESQYRQYISCFMEDAGCVTQTKNGNYIIDLHHKSQE